MGVALLGASCATEYPFRYYALQKDGVLLASRPENDTTTSECFDVNGKKINCIVYFLEEHKKVQSEYLKMAVELEACQRGL